MNQIIDANGTVWRWNPVWRCHEKAGQLTPPERDPAKAIEGMKILMDRQNGALDDGKLRLPF